MPLKSCRECKKEVSSEAKTCPHCGTPNPTTDPAAAKKGCVGCLGVLGFFLLIGMCFQDGSDTTSPESRSSNVADLSARVQFTGTQFVITNADNTPWTNVVMEINGGFIRGGYELKAARMVPGETYTVGAAQFAKSNGERFNPFAMKPQRFCIRSRDSNDSTKGLWCGGWN